jgi:methyl-accepting chemotaxis protein
VLSKFQHSGAGILLSAQQLEQESAHVQNDIGEILVNLQFQDRVSQVLINVTDNMQKLRAVINEQKHCLQTHKNIEPINIAEWLTSLNKTYTKLEQAAIHQGNHGASMQNQTEVTLF